MDFIKYHLLLYVIEIIVDFYLFIFNWELLHKAPGFKNPGIRKQKIGAESSDLSFRQTTLSQVDHGPRCFLLSLFNQLHLCTLFSWALNALTSRKTRFFCSTNLKTKSVLQYSSGRKRKCSLRNKKGRVNLIQQLNLSLRLIQKFYYRGKLSSRKMHWQDKEQNINELCTPKWLICYFLRLLQKLKYKIIPFSLFLMQIHLTF